MAPAKSMGSLSAMAKDIKKKTAAVKSSLPSASASFKSADRVQDSDTSSSDDTSSSGSDSDNDSEDGLEAAKRKLEAKNAAKKASVPKSQPNGKTTKPAPPAVATAKSVAKKATSSSSEDTSSSDSGSDSDLDSDEKKAAPAKRAVPASTKTAKQLKADSDDSGSDSDSDSDGDSEAGAKVQSIAGAIAQKASKVNKALPAKTTAEESDSSDSDSEMDDEPSTEVVAKTNRATESTEVSRPEWLNKSDFMLRKAASDNPGKEVSEFLSKSNLDDKQVWYFTAPASLPITVIKDMEIDLAKAQSGGAILSHQGDSYGLDLEPYTTSSQIQLLIPSKGGEKYNPLDRAIDSTVHLRRIAEFGGASKVSSTATDQYVRKIRPVREQPKNLKPRFTPIGVPTQKPSAVPIQKPQAPKAKPAESSDSSSSDGDSDVEMTDAATLPPSVLAKKAGTTASGVKRKQDSDSDSDTSSSESEDEVPPPKAKSAEKSSKRAKTSSEMKLEKPTTSSAPAVQGENTGQPASQLSLSEKKATPIPPPTIGRSFSHLSSANDTPSKAPATSTSKKDKKLKKNDKAAESASKTIKQTPIPVPTFGASN